MLILLYLTIIRLFLHNEKIRNLSRPGIEPRCFVLTAIIINGVSPPRGFPVAQEGSGHLVPIESGLRRAGRVGR